MVRLHSLAHLEESKLLFCKHHALKGDCTAYTMEQPRRSYCIVLMDDTSAALHASASG
jgi:hypothetical protein